MEAYRRPLIPITLSYLTGIGLGAHLPVGVVPALIVCVLTGAYFIRRFSRDHPLRLAPIILMAALGYLSILPWAAPRFPSHHVIHQIEAGTVTLTGEVISRPRRQSGRTKFVFDTRTLRSDQSDRRSAGKVRVTLSGELPPVKIGQTLALTGRLRALKNFQNPGGFDYVRSMAFDEIWASIYCPARRMQVLAEPHRGVVMAGLDRIRNDAGRLIDLSADGDPAAVLKALLIGDRSQIRPELGDHFRRAGVSHILAISGLHIGIVAAAAFAVLSWTMRRSQYVLQRGWYRKLAAGLAIIPVIGYALIAGMSPSTQRAVLMAAVFLAAFWVERELDTFSSLAVAALIILIIYPPSLFSISFQLSFAAVSAIIFGFERIKKKSRKSAGSTAFSKTVMRIRRTITGMVLVSLFAIWGTLPLTMTYFNQVSIVGVIANLVVVPVIGFGVVPSGLVALCIWPLSSAAASAVLALAAWLLARIIPVIELFARLPVSSFTTWTPTALEIGCYYILSGSILIMLTRPAKKDQENRPAVTGELAEPAPPRYRTRWVRRLSAIRSTRRGSEFLLGLVLILALLIAGGDTLYWLHQRYWHRDLKIHILDVGHGNASLVEFPGGQTLLIDGGGFSDITSFDLGARVLAPYLRRRKILTVDILVLSHPNSDHMNGLIFVAGHFNVKQLWTNGESRATLGYQLLMECARDHRILMPDFRAIARERDIGGVQLKILYPPPEFLSRRANERWRDTNNNSLVVKLIHGNHAFLFPGDITRKAETELVDICGAEVRSDVLIVPHHGSKSSSSPVFLDAVAPQVAIISANDRGKGRHPHPAVVERYRSRDCRLLYTETQGAVRLVSDGRNLKIKPFVTE